jgi:hypothetical protein
VATRGGELVEVQGTGEQRSFRREELDRLLDLAGAALEQLYAQQDRVLAPTLEEVRAAANKGRRRAAPPKNEADLWRAPR